MTQHAKKIEFTQEDLRDIADLLEHLRAQPAYHRLAAALALWVVPNPRAKLRRPSTPVASVALLLGEALGVEIDEAVACIALLDAGVPVVIQRDTEERGFIRPGCALRINTLFEIARERRRAPARMHMIRSGVLGRKG